MEDSGRSRGRENNCKEKTLKKRKTLGEIWNNGKEGENDDKGEDIGETRKQ